MRGKNLLWISLVALLLTSVFMVGTVTSSASAIMYVYPKKTTGIVPPNTFTVDIKADVDNLYAWEFDLSFTPITLLRVTNVARGSFLEQAGLTMWQYYDELGIPYPMVIDNINGLVSVGDLLLPPEFPPEGASGSGVLATIEFEVIGYGVCILDLQELVTELDTLTGGALEPIVHTVEDGLFDNRPEILEPHAEFTFEQPNVTRPVAGLPITFDASLSNDDADSGWIVSYDWDFGDLTTDSGKIVDHTFAEVGTYTVSLTVTDNDGLTDSMSTIVTVVEWMEGGTFPDLIEAEPELVKWNEVSRGRELKLFGLVGNPTEANFEVYVEFTIYSTEEARKLGTTTTDTFPIGGGETLELDATMDLRDTRWRVGPSGVHRYIVWVKYTAIARCYYRPVGDDDFQKGFVAKDFGYKVHPAPHDIAVVEVTTNATNGVQKGNLLEINVTIANEGGGGLTETFNITVTYRGVTTPETELEVRQSEIEGGEIEVSRKITLPITKTETFILPTSDLTAEAYIITATLSILTYEVDTIDNRGTCVIGIIE